MTINSGNGILSIKQKWMFWKIISVLSNLKYNPPPLKNVYY